MCLPSGLTLINCVIHNVPFLECGSGNLVPAPGWVIIVVERNRTLHTIASAAEALDMLFTNWPVVSGTAFVLALEACAGTVSGAVTQEEAQSAFLAAAVEAKVAFRIA
ncbi:DUF982 domain-containing protein [Rhizobium mesoamericanum]|uniref:DUF982 domain-containing protein n=1 Tax=Rhizobium mesoamericanum STM3625 TaxID=1211777 RepID=K0PXK2_9HYPH|nr:DUF982 domain-containing protein [Rhizobium mesoamericanum]CCM78588.1 conserved hypothetical protein [Rhizobium mesoamericanum STM3625]